MHSVVHLIRATVFRSDFVMRVQLLSVEQMFLTYWTKPPLVLNNLVQLCSFGSVRFAILELPGLPVFDEVELDYSLSTPLGITSFHTFEI